MLLRTFFSKTYSTVPLCGGRLALDICGRMQVDAKGECATGNADIPWEIYYGRTHTP